jgi:hypothetical protein
VEVDSTGARPGAIAAAPHFTLSAAADSAAVRAVDSTVAVDFTVAAAVDFTVAAADTEALAAATAADIAEWRRPSAVAIDCLPHHPSCTWVKCMVNDPHAGSDHRTALAHVEEERLAVGSASGGQVQVAAASQLGGLRSLAGVAKRPVKSYVVFLGEHAQRFDDNILAVPFVTFLQDILPDLLD